MATKQDLMGKYGADVVTDLINRGNNGEIEATKQLAEWGFFVAQFIVGNHYQRIGNISNAILWWEKAAVQGYIDAIWNLGYTYENGEGELPENPKKAIGWYNTAAAMGHPKAKLRLGIMYCWGEHIEYDPTKGKALIEEAETAMENSEEELNPFDYLGLGTLFFDRKISLSGMPSIEDTEKCVAYLAKALDGFERFNLQDAVEHTCGFLAKAEEKLKLLQ